MNKLSVKAKSKPLSKFYLSALIALGLVVTSAFTGTKIVHADETWSATLPAAQMNTYTGRTYCYGVNRYTSATPTPKISLTRIVNGPSYYMKAHMENSQNTPVTDTIKVQQGAGLTTFTHNTMSSGHYYYLVVSNNYFEVVPRSAYGYLSGFYTID